MKKSIAVSLLALGLAFSSVASAADCTPPTTFWSVVGAIVLGVATGGTSTVAGAVVGGVAAGSVAYDVCKKQQ